MISGLPRVVVTHWVHPEVVAYLRQFSDPAVPDVGGVWTHAQCPRLRIVAATLKGYDNFDAAPCARHDHPAHRRASCRPHPRDHAQGRRTRGHILAVARELLPEVGSAGLTYSLLADRAGVTRQTLYRTLDRRYDLSGQGGDSGEAKRHGADGSG